MKKFINIFLLSLVLFSCGENTWDKALKENSIDGFKTYIEKNPESEFIKVAKFKLDSLLNNKDSICWLNAEKLLTKEEFEKYLIENPKGKHIEDAQKQIKNIIDDKIWAEAKSKNSLEEISKFIEENPENRNRELALGIMGDFLKDDFDVENKDIVEFIYKMSSNCNFSTLKNYINNKIVYYDSIACFGVSGEDCDKCTKSIITDSLSFEKVYPKSAFLCLVENYKNGGFNREYYDYDGSILNEEFFEYELTSIPNGLKMKVYEDYADYTFTFIRKNNKLFLTEIFAYEEQTDI